MRGITYNDVNPDYVVVGESGGYNLEMVTKAIRLVQGGAKLIGTNYDVTGIESGLDTYAHVLPDTKKKEMEKLNALIS